MTRLAPALLAALALSGCLGDRARLADDMPVTTPADVAGDISQLRDRGDLDQFAGKRVTAEGVFDQVQGRHGLIRLDTGLVVYLPHFDHFRRGDDWFRYVGRRVTVGGILHPETGAVPGINGPAIAPETFASQE